MLLLLGFMYFCCFLKVFVDGKADSMSPKPPCCFFFFLIAEIALAAVASSSSSSSWMVNVSSFFSSGGATDAFGEMVSTAFLADVAATTFGLATGFGETGLECAVARTFGLAAGADALTLTAGVTDFITAGDGVFTAGVGAFTAGVTALTTGAGATGLTAGAGATALTTGAGATGLGFSLTTGGGADLVGLSETEEESEEEEEEEDDDDPDDEADDVDKVRFGSFLDLCFELLSFLIAGSFLTFLGGDLGVASLADFCWGRGGEA